MVATRILGKEIRRAKEGKIRMPYINNEKIAEIRNALATILRASLDTKQDNRLEDIIRHVGRIGGLLPNLGRLKRK